MSSQSYRYLSSRLASYVNYPDSAIIRPSRLANTGFYSSGKGEEVTCYGCGVSHISFQPGSNIRRAHMLRSPDCPLKTICDALQVDDAGACGNNVDLIPEYLPRPAVNRPIEADDGGRTTILYYSVKLQRSIPFNRSEPDFKLLAHEEIRLRRFTFFNWPNRKEESDYCEQLASQGLFYTGKLKLVQCCSCGAMFKASNLDLRQDICLSECRCYF